MSSNSSIAKCYTEKEMRSLVHGHLFIITPENRERLYTYINTARRTNSLCKVMIFYETNHDPNRNIRGGHWTCVAARGSDIYFFDSLGLFPDDELDKIPAKYRMMSNQTKRTLGNILFTLSRNGYRIHYNDMAYQENDLRVNTCGRYCALFLNEGMETGGDPYKVVNRILNKYKRPDEDYYDQAIIRLNKY